MPNTKISCNICQKSTNYLDSKDLRDQKWVILGINMNDNIYVATCPKCYKKPAKLPKLSDSSALTNLNL